MPVQAEVETRLYGGWVSVRCATRVPRSALITTRQLSMRYGPKALFEGVDLQLMPGNRYGLIGANGSGKSTFLRILQGEEHPTDGEVLLPGKEVRIGFLRQDQSRYDEMSLIETVLEGRPKLAEARAQMAKLLEGHFAEAEAKAFAKWEQQAEMEDGYAAEADAAALLSGLGLGNSLHDQPMKELSGGWRLRVLLAQTLFCKPDILLLDEPTNHLDIDSIRWLDFFLKQYNGLLVLISHDRSFIESVCTHILDVDYGTVRMFKGGYQRYLIRLQEEKEWREAALLKNESKKAQLQDFVDKFRAKATKARQAQSKMKLIDKLGDEIDSQAFQPSSRRSPNLRFIQERPAGVEALRVHELSKAYEEKVVLKNVEFEVERGDRLAVIGPNGTGKSTLLKIIAEQVRADSGIFKWGHAARFSFFPQEVETDFDTQESILDWLARQGKGRPRKELHDLLGRCLFSGDDAKKRADRLSGGEMARMILARMMMEEANVLLLDEPTNHLDIEGVEALAEALLQFPGTIIFVSHNRWFVSRLANKILEVRHQGVQLFPGDYPTFLSVEENRDHLDRAQAKSKSPVQPVEKVKKIFSEEDRKKQKELRNQIRAVEKKVDDLESKIEKLNLRMAASEFYSTMKEAARQDILHEHLQTSAELDRAVEEWDRLSALLEKIN